MRKTALSRVEEISAIGISVSHVYPIIDLIETAGMKFVKLKNPWGLRSWQGAWCDGHSKWHDHPEVNDKLRPHSQDISEDGVYEGYFFMEFSDFCEYYNTVYSCRVVNGAVVVRAPNSKGGMLRRESNWPTLGGGCINHSSWRANPQFQLSVTADNTEVLISLMQPDGR